MKPVSVRALVAGIVWVVSGVILVVVKVDVLPSTASVYWEYVGGFMILFGLVRLLYGILRGNRDTKPGLWSGYI